MTDPTSELGERARKAARIIAQPEQYKVCESCESIVRRRVPTCPNCHGYRFNEDSAAVSQQAAVLASRIQTSVPPENLR